MEKTARSRVRVEVRDFMDWLGLFDCNGSLQIKNDDTVFSKTLGSDWATIG
jgi:ABC-type transporter lipoprotein component MlaA